MNKFNNLKPEVKAILLVSAILLGGFGLGAVINYINPAALAWVCIAFLIYTMYNLTVGYFKFSTNVDKLNEKYEDKK